MLIVNIIVAVFSLIALIIIHEFGHFVLAKKFGAKVEEFGIGIPPRIFGKKIGETIYSLNILPFGAFVRIQGEEGGVENYRSFIGKPMWQRVSIVLGGVVSFWIISTVLLALVAGIWGLPMAVEDEDNYNLTDAKIQITSIFSDSPAEQADLRTGDVFVDYDRVSDFQEFIQSRKSQEIELVVKRGQDSFSKSIVLRGSETPLGVGLARIGLRQYTWYQAPVQGIVTSFNMTANIINGWVIGLKSLFGISQLPEGVKMEMMGPIGILNLLREYSKLGINYFLFLISLISIALALANMLPIPALDGGKLVFLGIESIRGKPINYKLEQKITATFFVLLILLMIFITIKFDIPRVF